MSNKTEVLSKEDIRKHNEELQKKIDDVQKKFNESTDFCMKELYFTRMFMYKSQLLNEE